MCLLGFVPAPGRRFSTRAKLIEDVNHSPTWFRRPSAGGGPIAVRARVEFASVRSRLPAAGVIERRSIDPLRTAWASITAKRPPPSPRLSLHPLLGEKQLHGRGPARRAGLLEHRLEVRLRGLQSILVRLSRAKTSKSLSVTGLCRKSQFDGYGRAARRPSLPRPLGSQITFDASVGTSRIIHTQRGLPVTLPVQPSTVPLGGGDIKARSGFVRSRLHLDVALHLTLVDQNVVPNAPVLLAAGAINCDDYPVHDEPRVRGSGQPRLRGAGKTPRPPGPRMRSPPPVADRVDFAGCGRLSAHGPRRGRGVGRTHGALSPNMQMPLRRRAGRAVPDVHLRLARRDQVNPVALPAGLFRHHPAGG